ncbi:MAG: PorT family protein [Cyclobacteriaceae bacterium]
MKTTLTSLLTLCCLLTFGQIKTYVGARASGQVASAYIEHTIGTTFITPDFITGYSGGAFIKIFTKKRDALINPGFQSGLFFDQKGWGQVFDGTEEPKYKVKMSYVQLPMEAIINFGRGKTKTFFTIGWYLEYLLNVSKSEQPNLEELESFGYDFYTFQSGRDRKIGYGGRGSVGVQRDFGFGAVHLDAFFTFNISSVIDHQDFKTGIPDLSNLYTIGFSLGYLIPFGKLDY